MKISTSYFGETNIGKRSNNEDSLCTLPIDEKFLLLAVADGMGGAIAGEKASRIAIDTLVNSVQKKASNRDVAFLKQLLLEVYQDIQQKISEETGKNPSLNGMGTTLNVAFILEGNKVIYSNLGDSRVYLLYKGILTCLTRDHSYIQEFEEKHPGEATPEFIRNFSNYITRSLDGGNDLPDIYPPQQEFLELKEGSILLLCSDGLILHKENELEVLKSILLGNNLRKAVTSLIDNAIQRGSTDNISVILYEYGQHHRPYSWLTGLFTG